MFTSGPDLCGKSIREVRALQGWLAERRLRFDTGIMALYKNARLERSKQASLSLSRKYFMQIRQTAFL